MLFRSVNIDREVKNEGDVSESEVSEGASVERNATNDTAKASGSFWPFW